MAEQRRKTEDKAVIAAHPLLQGVGNGFQGHQLFQTVCADGHIGDLPGDGGTGMDSDTDICRRQSGRIVDAVADHHHRMSFGFGPFCAFQ